MPGDLATRTAHSGGAASLGKTPLGLLCLTAMGVVYGDIGTSPLYALRECFFGSHSVPVTRESVLGVLSLIFWALVIVVTLKYHVYVLRMDNRGEGGILALMALTRPRYRRGAGAMPLIMVLGLFGAALLYGDGIITPAISVLSAVEGLEVATVAFRPMILPVTVVILLGLFLVQRHGTARIGVVFGPIMLLWFTTLAVLGVVGVLRAPEVLAAVNPAHAVRFFHHYGTHGFLVLGAVFLATTGGEALYADLGHFGERPIQIDWFLLVGPALVLNYFGQGALLLTAGNTVTHPLYEVGPAWALYPLVALATAATVIASQAVISGAFSLTRQAVQLGYLPRMEIVHTSAEKIGQIYVPTVNWLLMVATVGLVVAFKTSSNLAAAYGMAVTATMVITTLLAFFVTRRVFHWNVVPAVLVTLGFLGADLAFFAANVVKIPRGGWFPLVVAAIVFAVMTAWMGGREILRERLEEGLVQVDSLIRDVVASELPRVPGTAVFLAGTPRHVPPAFMHNLKHNKVIHEKVVFLTVITEEVPRVTGKDRLVVTELGHGFFRIVVKVGFMERIDVPKTLGEVDVPGLSFPPMETSYFLGKETILATSRPGMAPWREHLFALMSRNARDATSFFGLPPNRVVELGSRVEI